MTGIIVGADLGVHVQGKLFLLLSKPMIWVVAFV